MSTAMHDSGKRDEFHGGAVRDANEEKPRPDLVSPWALSRLGEWLRLGAKKYKPRNWEKGIPISRCMQSLCRHVLAYQKGGDGEDHMAAIMCNSMFILHYEEAIKAGFLPKELADMPEYVSIEGEQPDIPGLDDWIDESKRLAAESVDTPFVLALCRGAEIARLRGQLSRLRAISECPPGCPMGLWLSLLADCWHKEHAQPPAEDGHDWEHLARNMAQKARQSQGFEDDKIPSACLGEWWAAIAAPDAASKGRPPIEPEHAGKSTSPTSAWKKQPRGLDDGGWFPCWSGWWDKEKNWHEYLTQIRWNSFSSDHYTPHWEKEGGRYIAASELRDGDFYALAIAPVPPLKSKRKIPDADTKVRPEN